MLPRILDCRAASEARPPLRRQGPEAWRQVRAVFLLPLTSRLPRGWRDDEDSDEAVARWDCWYASDGETEAEGDARWQRDEDDSTGSDEDGDDEEGTAGGECTRGEALTFRNATSPQVHSHSMLQQLSPAQKLGHAYVNASLGCPATRVRIPGAGANPE